MVSRRRASRGRAASGSGSGPSSSSRFGFESGILRPERARRLCGRATRTCVRRSARGGGGVSNEIRLLDIRGPSPSRKFARDSSPGRGLRAREGRARGRFGSSIFEDRHHVARVGRGASPGRAFRGPRGSGSTKVRVLDGRGASPLREDASAWLPFAQATSRRAPDPKPGPEASAYPARRLARCRLGGVALRVRPEHRGTDMHRDCDRGEDHQRRYEAVDDHGSHTSAHGRAHTKGNGRGPRSFSVGARGAEGRASSRSSATGQGRLHAVATRFAAASGTFVPSGASTTIRPSGSMLYSTMCS